MIKIALSYKDNYIDRVKKIMDDFPNCVDYFYVEDYINNAKSFLFTSNDIIYILNNSSYNLLLIKKMKNKVHNIINEKFYSHKYNKLDMQERIKKNNILVPNILKYNNLTKYNFPLFFKSVNHADIVLKVYNRNSLDILLTKFKNNFYLEESLENYSKEYKVYFIKNAIYFDDNYKKFMDEKIKQICLKISEVLQLELFSVDIIMQDGYYYVIDINPSAGLYKSSKSRKKLVEEFKI
mgnify:CR=1 FL=1